MNELERAQRKFDLITMAICSVKLAAEEERKITHSKHIDPVYDQVLDLLDAKITGTRAYLTRIEAIGR